MGDGACCCKRVICSDARARSPNWFEDVMDRMYLSFYVRVHALLHTITQTGNTVFFIISKDETSK